MGYLLFLFVGYLCGYGASGEVSDDLCLLPTGNFPHPNDCTSFIRCSDGVAEVKTCSNGLLFNPFLITCDFSLTESCSTEEDFEETTAPVETNDASCSEDGPNVFPIPRSCAEYYYLCINGTAYRAQCPELLLMDSNKMTCDFPDDIQCNASINEFPKSKIAAAEESNSTPDPENNSITVVSTEVTTNENFFTNSKMLSTKRLKDTTTIETVDRGFFTSKTPKYYSLDILNYDSTSSIYNPYTNGNTARENMQTSSASMTELATNKSTTVITESTQQTKGVDDMFETNSDLSSSKLITTLRTSVEAEITEYNSTMNDRATSSYTANPVTDARTSGYFAETLANISQTQDQNGTTVQSTEIKTVSLTENINSEIPNMTEAGATLNFDEMKSSVGHKESSMAYSGMTLSSLQTEESLNFKKTSKFGANATISISELNSETDTSYIILKENDRSASITELPSLSEAYLTNMIVDSSTLDSVSLQRIYTVAETSENNFASDEEIGLYSETSEFTTKSITTGHERTNKHTDEFEITEGMIPSNTPTIDTLMPFVLSTGSSTEELQTTPIRTASEIQPNQPETKPTEITVENSSIFSLESHATEEAYTSVYEENKVIARTNSIESYETDPQESISTSTSKSTSSVTNEELYSENISTPEPTGSSSLDFAFKSTDLSKLAQSSITTPLLMTNTLTITTDHRKSSDDLSTVSASHGTGKAAFSEKLIDIAYTFTNKENPTDKSGFSESQTDATSENDAHAAFYALDKIKSTIKEEITPELTKISSTLSSTTDVSSIETVTGVDTSESSPGSCTTLESKLTEISSEYTSTPYSSLEDKLETLSTEMTTTQKDFIPETSSRMHSEVASKSSDQTIVIDDNTRPTSSVSKSNELNDLASTIEATNEYEDVTEITSVPFKSTTTEDQPSQNPSMTSEMHTVTASKRHIITVDLDETSSVLPSSDHTFDTSIADKEEDIIIKIQFTSDDQKPTWASALKQTDTPLSSPSTTAEVKENKTTETSTATTSKMQSSGFPEIFTETTSSYETTTDMNSTISETSTLSLPPSTRASTSEITLKITSAATRENIPTKMSANFETSQNTEMLFTDAISTTYTLSPEIATGTQENIRNETTFSTETSETIQETSTDLTVSTITGTSTFSPNSKETSDSSLLTSKNNSYISNTSEIATSELYDNVTKDDQTFTENPSTSDITTTYLKQITNSSEMTKGIKVSPTNLEETSTDASSSYISTTESTTNLNEEITTERPPSEISETDITYTDLPFTLSKTSVASNMFETSPIDISGKANALSTEIFPESTSEASRVSDSFTTDASNKDAILSTLPTTDTIFSKSYENTDPQEGISTSTSRITLTVTNEDLSSENISTPEATNGSSLDFSSFKITELSTLTTPSIKMPLSSTATTLTVSAIEDGRSMEVLDEESSIKEIARLEPTKITSAVSSITDVSSMEIVTEVDTSESSLGASTTLESKLTEISSAYTSTPYSSLEDKLETLSTEMITTQKEFTPKSSSRIHSEATSKSSDQTTIVIYDSTNPTSEGSESNELTDVPSTLETTNEYANVTEITSVPFKVTTEKRSSRNPILMSSEIYADTSEGAIITGDSDGIRVETSDNFNISPRITKKEDYIMIKTSSTTDNSKQTWASTLEQTDSTMSSPQTTAEMEENTTTETSIETTSKMQSSGFPEIFTETTSSYKTTTDMNSKISEASTLSLPPSTGVSPISHATLKITSVATLENITTKVLLDNFETSQYTEMLFTDTPETTYTVSSEIVTGTPENIRNEATYSTEISEKEQTSIDLAASKTATFEVTGTSIFSSKSKEISDNSFTVKTDSDTSNISGIVTSKLYDNATKYDRTFSEILSASGITPTHLGRSTDGSDLSKKNVKFSPTNWEKTSTDASSLYISTKESTTKLNEEIATERQFSEISETDISHSELLFPLSETSITSNIFESSSTGKSVRENASEESRINQNFTAETSNTDEILPALPTIDKLFSDYERESTTTEASSVGKISGTFQINFPRTSGAQVTDKTETNVNEQNLLNFPSTATIFSSKVTLNSNVVTDISDFEETSDNYTLTSDINNVSSESSTKMSVTRFKENISTENRSITKSVETLEESTYPFQMTTINMPDTDYSRTPEVLRRDSPPTNLPTKLTEQTNLLDTVTETSKAEMQSIAEDVSSEAPTLTDSQTATEASSSLLPFTTESSVEMYLNGTVTNDISEISQTILTESLDHQISRSFVTTIEISTITDNLYTDRSTRETRQSLISERVASIPSVLTVASGAGTDSSILSSTAKFSEIRNAYMYTDGTSPVSEAVINEQGTRFPKISQFYDTAFESSTTTESLTNSSATYQLSTKLPLNVPDIATEASPVTEISESFSEVTNGHNNGASRTTEILSTHIISTSNRTSGDPSSINGDIAIKISNISETEKSHDISSISPSVAFPKDVSGFSKNESLKLHEMTISTADLIPEIDTHITEEGDNFSFKYSTKVSIYSPDASYETSPTPETSDGEIMTDTTIGGVSIEKEVTSKPNIKVHTNSMDEMLSIVSNSDQTREPLFDTLITYNSTMDNICIKGTGVYPNPDDCGTFYLCFEGKPEMSYCTGNFHFNPERDMCEEPCKAMCDKNADCPTSTIEDDYISTPKRQTEFLSAATQTQESSTFDLDTTEDNWMTSSIATSEVTDITNIFPTQSTKTSQTETEISKFVTDSITKSSDITDTISEVAQTPQDSTTKDFTTYLFSDNFPTDKLNRTAIDIRSTPSTSSVALDIGTLDTGIPDLGTVSESTTEFENTSSDVPKFSTNGVSTVSQVETSTLKDNYSTLSTSSMLTEAKISFEGYISTDLVTSTFISDGTLSTSETTGTECENPEACSSTEGTEVLMHIPFSICRRRAFIPIGKCDRFINCTTEVPKMEKCANGLHFNPTSRVCDWPYKAGCGGIAEPLYEPDDSFTCPCRSCLIPSRENCEEYYLCLGFIAYRMNCSNNLLFDSRINTCTYAHEVDCPILAEVSTQITELHSPTAITLTAESTIVTSTTEEIESSTMKSATSKSFVCPSSNVLLKHPENCHAFIQCSNGRPYTLSCPESLHYSEEKQICDYPCNAKCDLSLRCGATSEVPSDTRCPCDNCKLPSTKTCTKYIECINGVPRSVNCPRGQTFDTNTSACDWAHKVNCQHSEMCPKPNGLFAHKSDCHKFIHCSNGIPYVKKCPYKLEFDLEKRRCVWPSGSCNPTPDASYESSLTSPETSDGGIMTETTTVGEVTIEKELASKPNIEVYTSSMEERVSTVYNSSQSREPRFDKLSTDSTTISNICIKATGFYPNPDDCGTFYFCSNGIPELSYCTENFHFNPVRKMCEEPCKAMCDKNAACPSTADPDIYTYIPFGVCRRSDLIPIHKCDKFINCTTAIPKVEECAKGLHFNPTSRVCDWPYKAGCGGIAGPIYETDDSFTCPCRSCLLPSNENCQEYYLCLGFTAYRMKCSNNLLFDSRINTCTYVHEVDCPILAEVSTQITELHSPITTFTAESTTVKSTTKGTEYSTKRSRTSKAKPFVCPSSNGLFKHPENCQAFIQCSNGRPYIMSCPASLHFSEEKQICDYPCNAKCDLSLRCGVPSESPSDPRCPCHNCKLPSPDTCTKYIECMNGVPRSANCPWGQTFDANRSTCDWAHKVNCQHSVICQKSNGLFAHKDDCHKFVHCSNGIPYIKKCPYKLEFDPAKQRCEWPSGRCNISISVQVLDIFKTEEQRAGWKCPKTFGYFAAEQCNKFYYCSLGVPSLKECPDGLLYNPRIQNCDWKKHVYCDSRRHLDPKKCRVYNRHVTCPKSRTPLPHVQCNMYYECSSGAACAKRCPIRLDFNRTSGLCDLPVNAKCFRPTQEQYSLKDFSLSCAAGDKKKMVDPVDKACFYHCQHGNVISGCCSKGYTYNEQKDVCELITRTWMTQDASESLDAGSGSSDSSD